MSIVSAQPVCAAYAAHGMPGPSACAAYDCVALRASAHRSGHRSLGATLAEVEQGNALEHPRRRGNPSDMWVEAVAHRSFLPTGRGGKTGSAAVFSDDARDPAAGGGPASGWRGRGSSAQESQEKKRQGGRCSGSAHRGGFRDGGGGRIVVVACSGRGLALGRRRGQLRAREVARSGRRARDEARRRRQRGGVFGHGRSGRLLARPVHSDIAAHGSQLGRGARRHCH
jgi:hypothetical protein